MLASLFLRLCTALLVRWCGDNHLKLCHSLLLRNRGPDHSELDTPQLTGLREAAEQRARSLCSGVLPGETVAASVLPQGTPSAPFTLT